MCDAYRAQRSNLDNGNHGPKGSARRERIEPAPIAFRADSAHPYDQRDLSFAPDARTISPWTLPGRLKGVPFIGSANQLTALAEHKRGEADLLRSDGTWFLAVTVDAPDAPVIEPDTRTGTPPPASPVGVLLRGMRGGGHTSDPTTR
ncbi:hypothetical protein [Nocardiopsis halotolerans]|uniref:hypothetical protein n=1 Tax=Nocardiopsis halotolerans TaxID=124252 RepID=UPI00034C1FE3|nr:hypothetical protein [Nocardiopsis halotolerans]